MVRARQTYLTVLLPLFLFAVFASSYSQACNQQAVLEQPLLQNEYYAFVQTKTVAALSRPLISRGVIGLTGNDQLLWQVQKPIKSTLVLSDREFLRFNRNDELQPEVGNSIATEISQILYKMFKGDLANLEEKFTQKFSCQDGLWSFVLTPKAEPLTLVFSSIEIQGNEFLEKLSITEARGDKAVITLNKVSSDTSTDFGKYLEK